MNSLMGNLISQKSRLAVIFLLAITFNVFNVSNCYAFAVEKLRHVFVTLPGGKEVEYTFTGKPIHEEITISALRNGAFQFPAVTLADGSPAHFSEQAIYILQLNNMLADRDENAIEIHFDDENFNKGNERLFNLRQQIVQAAQRGKYLEARIKLGGALHTVQDFYAHTTWVELHPNAFDLAKLGESNTFQSEFGIPSESQVTCDFKGLTLPFHLTSGYFTKIQLAGNNSYASLLNSGKCIHGSSFYSNIEGSADLEKGAGINKDKSNRQNFGVAKGFAIRATREYVNNILQDLKSTPEAICGLMDQVCGEKPISSACTFSNLRVGPGGYSVQLDTPNCIHPFVSLVFASQTLTCNANILDGYGNHIGGTTVNDLNSNGYEYDIYRSIPLQNFGPGGCLIEYLFKFTNGYDLDSNGIKHPVSFSESLTVKYDLR